MKRNNNLEQNPYIWLHMCTCTWWFPAFVYTTTGQLLKSCRWILLHNMFKWYMYIYNIHISSDICISTAQYVQVILLHNTAQYVQYDSTAQYVYVYKHINVFTAQYDSTAQYAQVICTSIHVYICISIYMYMYHICSSGMYIHIYVHIPYIYVHIPYMFKWYANPYICTFVHRYICTYVHIHPYICTYTIYVQSDKYIHICIHPYICGRAYHLNIYGICTYIYMYKITWTYDLMFHIWMTHVPRMNVSCPIYKRVMSHIWISHVPHISFLHNNRPTLEEMHVNSTAKSLEHTCYCFF